MALGNDGGMWAAQVAEKSVRAWIREGCGDQPKFTAAAQGRIASSASASAR